MIEIIAEGPIDTAEDHRVDRQDGWDAIVGRASIVERRTVQIDLELPQGHVNLEGYALSSPGNDWSIVDRFGTFLPDDIGPIEADRDEWTVEIAGEWFDWIQQADRYVVERPGLSILDALRTFKGWDETSDRTLDLAIEKAREIEETAVPVGRFGDPEYQRMRSLLRGLGMYVDIPESYRPEQTA